MGSPVRGLTPSERVVAFRRGEQWTQVAAAKWYGVDERTWRRYELGERPVPLTLLNWIDERYERDLAIGEREG